MFERFTERGRKVMSLARQEAQRLNCTSIDTEHILLGLIQEGGGVAAKVLKDIDVDMKRIRQEIEKRITPSTSPSMTLGQIPFAPRGQDVINQASDIASMMSHDVVGTEHILIGLLEIPGGIANEVLVELGLNPKEIRETVLDVLGAEGPTNPVPSLPDPAQMRASMTRISQMVEKANQEISALAKEYGVHGKTTPTKQSEVLQITRSGEKWGVYVLNGTSMEIITGARFEMKLEFLSRRKQMEDAYRKAIVDLDAMMKFTIEKRG